MRHHNLQQILDSDAWKNATGERHPQYFRVWQRVSVVLQQALRRWIPELHFRDPQRFEDLDTSYQFIIYAAFPPCYGRPRTEFTFDVADPGALPAAMRTIGRATQSVLESVEERLYGLGMPVLARRFAPVWHQDIFRAVKARPKLLIGLLASEARLINAVIDLAAMPNPRRFQREAGAALRKIAGDDMRELGLRALMEAVEVLTKLGSPVGGFGDLGDGGILENDHAGASGGPRCAGRWR